MRLLTITKVLLVLILPFLIFLLVADFAAFNDSFYKEKFLEYGVNKKLINPDSMHQKVMDFIEGKSNDLPNDFNSREQQHLRDVRSVVSALTIALYALIALFIMLLFVSGFTLKINSYITNFIGKVLLAGGLLTIIIAALIFVLIKWDFSASFESFHQTFFRAGTYMFDPAREMIVNLYPEQLFMDLGVRIAIWVAGAALLLALFGKLLLSKSKTIKRRG